MKCVVLGTGSWGTALAQVLADNGQEVLLWGRNDTEVKDINENHKNTKFFNTTLSEKLVATKEISVVQDAELVLFAVPTKAIEETLKKVLPYLHRPYIVNTAKGFHPVTHKRLSEVIAEILPEEKRKAIVSLIGPSHAEEVILRELTCINAVSEKEEDATVIQETFSNEYFRVYRNTDVIGAEIGVAIKNIMAIASGCLEGIGQGDNARAALMTRGLAEMTRFGLAAGGKAETFLGLDGVGDLIVTCTSKHSRNFMAGYEIGKQGSAKEFMKNNTKTVEGIAACKVIYEEAKQKGIDMPITNQVYKVVYEDQSPMLAITELMTRSLKAEAVKR